MYLVKSCFQQDNIKIRGTIRIGSLTEYREQEEKQIADSYEGTYRIGFSLKNFHMNLSTFNHINTNHDSMLYFHIKHLSIIGKSALFPNHIVLKEFDAEGHYTNNNRLIFCLSLLPNPHQATGIFPQYNSHWSFPSYKLQFIIKLISENLRSEIVRKIRSKEKIFNNQDKIDIEKIDLITTAQEVIYTERGRTLKNRDIYTTPEFLSSIYSNIKFIKPVEFINEKELRIVFDFYNKGQLLTPVIK